MRRLSSKLEPGTARGRIGGVLRLVAVAIGTAVVWLILAGSLQAAEVLAAGLVGIGAAGFGAVVRWTVGHRQTGVRPWLHHLPRLVVGAYSDSWTVLGAAVRGLAARQPAGRFRVVPYRVGKAGSDHDVGRRVLATLGTTVQPNSILVGFDPVRQQALLHELVPTDDDPILGGAGSDDAQVGAP